jgi:uncharacterized protein (DUF1501 family)
MVEIRRRDFLKFAGAGAAAAMVPGLGTSLLAQSRRGGSPALVVIYQRGGMDAINALIPYKDRDYRNIRPTIGIPSTDGDEGAGVLKLDSTFGLHPSLLALMPYWKAKQFAPIINVGSPHRTRSHFDAQDFMEYAAPGIRTVRNGWLNRYLSTTNKVATGGEIQFRALAMQGLLPRSLRGSYPVLAVPEKKVLQNDKVLDIFGDVYGSDPMMGKKEDDPVVASGQQTLATLKKYKEIIKKKREGGNVQYPSGKLGQKMKDIASVIHANAGLEVACVDVGGWDHHANEGGNVGTLSNMLKDVGDSLGAFGKDLGDRMDNTLVVVMTEFGRTCRENGNNGTDHGHGGAMFLLGGAVKGGRVHGDWLGLQKKDLYQGRDLPVTTDFRDVFAAVLQNHMKFDLPRGYFPDYKPGKIRRLF